MLRCASFCYLPLITLRLYPAVLTVGGREEGGGGGGRGD